MAKNKPTRLIGMELDEVSLVDVPANQHAHVVLFKGGVKEPPPGRTAFIGPRVSKGVGVCALVKHGEDGKAQRVQLEDPEGFESLRPVNIGESLAKLLEARFSWDSIQTALYAAAREAFGTDDEDDVQGYYPMGVHVRDIWFDELIIDLPRGMFRVPYTLTVNDAGTVTATLGEPVPVRMAYLDVPTGDDDMGKANDEPPLPPGALVSRLRALERMSGSHGS